MIARESVGAHRLSNQDFAGQMALQRVINPTWNDIECTVEVVRYFRGEIMRGCANQIERWVENFNFGGLPALGLDGFHNLSARAVHLVGAVRDFLGDREEERGRSTLESPIRTLFCSHEWYFVHHPNLWECETVTSLIRKVNFNAEYIFYHFDRLENGMDDNDSNS
jgi:hypothetical protein